MNVEAKNPAGNEERGDASTIGASRFLNTEYPIQLGWRIIVLGFGAFLLMAAVVPLGEGVPTQGIVATDTKRKAVQHLTGGIVTEIRVREGQMVNAGDVLMVLDPAVASANYQAVRQHYMTLRATQSRLLAEKAGSKSITFHPDLLESKDDAWLHELLVNQRSLFLARRRAQQHDLEAIADSITAEEGTLDGAMEGAHHRERQLALVQEEIDKVRGLSADGFVARTRLLELERQAADISADLAEVQGQAARARGAIAELKSRVSQRRYEYEKEIGSQLAEIEREVQADAEKMQAAGDDLGRTEIRAPVSGQVVGLAMQTVGGVIQPSQKVMDIVPTDESLLLEARIDPRLIDRVSVGQRTDIRLSNFSHSRQIVIPGQVQSLATDLLTETAPTGQNYSYYLARVVVTAEGLRKLGGRQLQPGMPAEVIIKTGERTLLSYLTQPLTRWFAVSMQEE